MNYPVWDLFFGHGLLMAVMASIHVFVSHFAVGGGLFLVIGERRARKTNDPALRAFIQSHSRFFARTTLVFGALTGVGIWFVVGLINPAGISALLRTFVWVWAIEWVLFAVEIAAVYLYDRGWQRMDPRTHEIVGWIYFATAWLSLAVINGILSFMLTPGDWLQSHALTDGFFNPTYAPALATRTLWAIALAGVYSLLHAAGWPDRATRRRLVRHCAAWVFGGALLASVAAVWYWLSIPEANRAMVGDDMPILVTAHTVLLAAGAAAALLALVFGLLRPAWLHRAVAAVVALLALAATGGAEWVREGVRKPFVISDYLMVNGVFADQVAGLQQQGALSQAIWVHEHGLTPQNQATIGRDLFRQLCQRCHTLNGYLALAPWVRHWPEPFLAEVLDFSFTMRGNMPLPPADRDEKRAIAHALRQAVPYEALDVSGEPIAAGQRVFAASCGVCHSIDGRKSLRTALTGMSAADVRNLIDNLRDNFDGVMPIYVGTPAERAVLSAYLTAAVAAPAESAP